MQTATALTQEDHERLTVMAEREWLDAVLNQDPDAATSLCDEKFVYMPQDHPRLVGPDQVAEFLEGFPKVDAGTQTIDALFGTQELAVLIGSITATLEVEGKKLSGEGKFLGTASKSSGKWLFTSACFNWDGPLS